jgi:hypothetical protein
MLAWNRQLASLEVLITVRFRGAVASDLVRVRACSCAVGKGWAHMFIRTVCAVGLHILRNLSSLVCKALSDYLAGQEGHCGGVVLGGIWVVIGCCGPSGLTWTTTWSRKRKSHFHGFESMQPGSLFYRSAIRIPNRNPREVFMFGFAWNK